MNDRGIDWPSVNAMQKETANRRMVWPDASKRILTVNWRGDAYNRRGRSDILHWVEENTTGLFYLGGNKLQFEDEKDEVLFRLSFND